MQGTCSCPASQCSASSCPGLLDPTLRLPCVDQPCPGPWVQDRKTAWTAVFERSSDRGGEDRVGVVGASSSSVFVQRGHLPFDHSDTIPSDTVHDAQRRSPIAQSADPVSDWSKPERILGSDRTLLLEGFPFQAFPIEPVRGSGSKGNVVRLAMGWRRSPTGPRCKSVHWPRRHARAPHRRVYTSPWLLPLLPGACHGPKHVGGRWRSTHDVDLRRERRSKMDQEGRSTTNTCHEARGGCRRTAMLRRMRRDVVDGTSERVTWSNECRGY